MDMSASIGETLRQARLEQGLELVDLEARTKVRARYLRALEAEDWDALPGEAYVRGFLRTYADALGLDGPALVEEYQRLTPPAMAEPRGEPVLERSRRPPGTGLQLRGGTLAGIAAAGVVVVLLILGLTGGSSEDGGGVGRKSGHGADRHRKTTTTTTPAPEPAQASVRLTPTGTVWVCLVDQSGKPLVNGETLTTGDDRGPFKGRRLQLTLGNGAMRIELNGKPVPVADAPDPQGFDLTPDGASALPPADRPTCT
jgi:transcriptional regulator with XRE-family HTH domain